MELSTALVNIAYAVYVGSTFFRDIFRLRVMLIVSSLAFLAWGIIDENPSVIVWNVVFGVFNTWQVWRLVRLRRSVRLSALERRIREECFDGMSDHDFLLFWEMGSAGACCDETLVRHGEANDRLLIVTDGTVVVRRHGEDLAHGGVGEFVGEMSLLRGVAASADVTAVGSISYREWTHERINGLGRSEPALCASVKASLAAGLSRKLAER
ncbi:MAG: cyclic nucleotide-binding domain-containing protein [Actinomycetota bacterium]